MINIYGCNNVTRDNSSICEVSHLRYRYRIDLRFDISCRWCHNNSSGGGTIGEIGLTASPIALDASKLVPVLVRTNGESFI